MSHTSKSRNLSNVKNYDLTLRYDDHETTYRFEGNKAMTRASSNGHHTVFLAEDRMVIPCWDTYRKMMFYAAFLLDADIVHVRDMAINNDASIIAFLSYEDRLSIFRYEGDAEGWRRESVRSRIKDIESISWDSESGILFATLQNRIATFKRRERWWRGPVWELSSLEEICTPPLYDYTS